MKKIGPSLVISIDCECDKSLDWTSSNPVSFNSIKSAIPHIFQPICNKYGAVPTYLISNEVLEDEKSVIAFKTLKGNYELGTHLHADYIEPLKKYEVYDGTLTSDFQCDFEYQIQKSKVENLTELFRARFGYYPASFRAGRFGANSETINILEQLGYKVDSSVLPGLRERTKTGEINFTKAPLKPYYPSSDKLCEVGDSNILEVPVSVCYNQTMRKIFGSRTIHGPKTMCDKILNRSFKSYIIRPSYHSARDMIRAAKKIISSRQSSIINMMFHSMEMVPGASPYVLNDAQAHKFFQRIEKFLVWWKGKGHQFKSLSQIADDFVV